MKALTIYDLNELLQKLTKASLEVSTILNEKGKSLQRLRICPHCKTVLPEEFCDHKEMMN